jgi:DNA-binding NtrC family response regulator
MVARPMHVAILDDDSSVRTALGRYLKFMGMEVDVCDTSALLFRVIALKRPDCLLLDFQMPEMNGLDVLKHLGQQLFRIPTVVMTAHDTADIRSACLGAGAIAYLEKPLDPERLITIIDGISASSKPDEFSAFG